MDKSTKEIIEALGHLGNVIAGSSSNAILADILEQLKDIYTAN